MLVSKVPCPMCSQLQLVTLLLELALCRLLVQTALLLFSKSLDLVSSVRQMAFYKRSYHAFLVLGASMMWPMQFFSRLLLS